MKLGTLPTQQEIDRYMELAEGGSADALQWLLEQNKTMAKRANSRMKYLEQKGQATTGAYKQAEFYLGETGRVNKNKQPRFSESKKLTLDELGEQLEQEQRFLRAQTSTIRGEKKRRKKIFESLADKGVIPEEDSFEDFEDFMGQMNDFFGSEVFSELKKLYKTTNVIAMVSEKIHQGYDVKDLMKNYEDYKKGKYEDLFEMWDDWERGR